jgi:3'(2'), 5'-bisphosphate nucleotidase
MTSLPLDEPLERHLIMPDLSAAAAARPDDLQTLLDSARELAMRAGQATLQIYGSDFAITHKDDRSPLTAADLASHRIIVAGLGERHPEIPVLSEESATQPYAERRAWRRYWLVDPLDGTREFIKRNGEFTVNIALVVDHEPVLGVVYAPVPGLAYFGGRGLGAWKAHDGAAALAIRVTHRRVTPLRVAGSRSHGGEGLQRFLARVGEHQLLSLGSSLKFCWVAEGLADVYPRLGPTAEWDTAAAQAVVEAAGGRVTDLQLAPLRYNTRESVLNPHFLAFGDIAADWIEFVR